MRWHFSNSLNSSSLFTLDFLKYSLEPSFLKKELISLNIFILRLRSYLISFYLPMFISCKILCWTIYIYSSKSTLGSRSIIFCFLWKWYLHIEFLLFNHLFEIEASFSGIKLSEIAILIFILHQDFISRDVSFISHRQILSYLSVFHKLFDKSSRISLFQHLESLQLLMFVL